MTRSNRYFIGLLFGFVGIALATNRLWAGGDKSGTADFIGSTPCTSPIRPLLRISEDTKADWIQWRLALHRDQSKAPAGYKLRCDVGAAVPGGTGHGVKARTFEREGRWSIGKGKQGDSNTEIYELDMGLSLVRVGDNVLHILNPDQSLMVGTAGWSYTLSRASAADKPGDVAVAMSRPSDSYRLSPLASGPEVFGIFEGRTPGQGISRVLKMPEDPGSLKVKWRVTLFQDAKTLAPTRYKLENSFLRDRFREGALNVVRGAKFDPTATVYRLEATKTEPAVLLLKGDDNVLFFLDQDGNPLVGHADFSYTLNRRSANQKSSDAKATD